MKAQHVGRESLSQAPMHSLDALRTVAMLTVVLVHAAISFAVRAPAGPRWIDPEVTCLMC